MNKKVMRQNRANKTSSKPQCQYTISNEQILHLPKTESVYPICMSDWDRLKRVLKTIQLPKRIYGFLASGCLGLFASALISVIDMYNRTEVADWFKITIWCILIISGILCIVFYCLDKQTIEYNHKSSEDVLTEMEIIESKYKPPLIDVESDSSRQL